MAKTLPSMSDYHRALKAVEAEGIHPAHRDLLRAHFAAPRHTVSWRELAPSVGYPNAEAVKLQYGLFARRIAEHLGITRRRSARFLAECSGWGGAKPGFKRSSHFQDASPIDRGIKATRLGRWCRSTVTA
jgi:hypothetical protein